METQQINIIEQLVDIYFNKEDWHEEKLSETVAIRYFSKLYQNNNIIVELRGSKVIGYIEVWALDHTQITKILDGERFIPEEEPISEGYYCYIANLYIEEEHKNIGLVRKLKRMAEEVNPQCQAVILNRHKYNNRFRFYKRR